MLGGAPIKTKHGEPGGLGKYTVQKIDISKQKRGGLEEDFLDFNWVIFRFRP